MKDKMTETEIQDIIQKTAEVLKPFVDKVEYTAETLDVWYDDLFIHVNGEWLPHMSSLRTELLRLKDELLENADEEISMFDDDTDMWKKAVYRECGIREAMEEIITDEIRTIMASDSTGTYSITIRTAGLDKEELFKEMHSCRKYDKPVACFVAKMAELGCEPVEKRIDWAF